MKESDNNSGRTCHVNRIVEAVAFRADLVALSAAVEAACTGEPVAGFATVDAPERQIPEPKRFRLDAEEPYL